MLTHYESLQEGTVAGTPLWGIFFGFGSAANQTLLSKVAAIWFFPLVFEVTMSTIVTHYGSLQEGAFNGTPFQRNLFTIVLVGTSKMRKKQQIAATLDNMCLNGHRIEAKKIPQRGVPSTAPPCKLS